jgi:lipopolysaccharide export system protein LptA
MMRRARSLFLLAIALITVWLGYTYRQRMEEQRRNAPALPKPLPRGTSATAPEGWIWEKDSEHGPAVSVRAKSFRQIKDPGQFELEQVDLRIYRRDGKSYDHVVSERAIFDMTEKFLYSEGQADITMGVAQGEESKPHRLIRIQSSGIRFDSATGKAETERAATFQMERGEGRAVGAVYDPLTKELLLKSQAQVTWYDRGAKPRPMKVDAGQMIYKEAESKVLLSPWAKLTRGTMTLEGAGAEVILGDEGIREVHTTDAKGADRQPTQTLEYAARQLFVKLNDRSEVERIEATEDARLQTTSSSGVTTTSADRVDMDFAAGSNDTTLQRVLATGKTVIESKPAARGNRPAAETRILRSEIVELKMRPGGQEIDSLDTQTPAVLEFLPNHPTQRRRRIDGDKLHIAYGDRNQIESCRITAASTRTEQPQKKPPLLTTSREMLALFAPQSGEMVRLEQWGDFRYEEGDRRASSERAILDQTTGRITLVQAARVWDPTGSTNADEILIDQRTEDYSADGNVTSSRLPDKKGSGSSLLAGDQPVQAKSHRMTTRDRQALVVYEGNAVLWQGANRLNADRIEIDRKNSVLRASGKVVSQLLDRKKSAPAQGKKQPPPSAASYMMVYAPAMEYHDKTRIADYTGGATLRRTGMDVKATRIRAFLREETKDPKPGAESGSSLDRAIADGKVVIVQSSSGRTRTGTAEHAEYYPNEEKVILEHGDPVLEDTLRGTTRGRQLTYYANDERLLVNGVPAQPAVSKIRRK